MFWTAGVSRGILRRGVVTGITFIVAHPRLYIAIIKSFSDADILQSSSPQMLMGWSSDLSNSLDILHFKTERTMVSLNDILILLQEFLTHSVI